MRRIAREYRHDPTIYGLTRHILTSNKVPEKNWSAEVNALFFFVRDRIRYTHDPLDMEGLQTPVETLRLGTGDCDDKVMLLAAMLLSINHPCQFVAVKVDGSDDFTHVFLRTKVGRDWLALETTEKWRPGQISPRITGKAMTVDV